MIEKEFAQEFLKFVRKNEDDTKDLSYFDVLTLMAFKYWQEKQAEIAVVEVGLGGARDSTNILNNVDLSIITGIGLDHTEILGDSIEEIAKEKLGILKANIPLLIGPTVPLDIAKQFAKSTASPLFVSDKHHLDYNEENKDLVRKAAEILSPKYNFLSKIDEAFRTTFSCRFELVSTSNLPFTFKPSLYLDVCHNLQGFTRQKSLLAALPKGISGERCQALIFTCLPSKASFLLFEHLLSYYSRIIILSAPSDSQTKYFSLSDLPDLRSKGVEEMELIDALKVLGNSDFDAVVFAGSFRRMSHLRQLLGIVEERDLVQLQENYRFL